MQISQAQHDEWVGTIQDLTRKEREARDISRDLQNQVNNFNEILDKIVRAAHGAPLIQREDVGYAMQAGYGYSEPQHRCQPPTTEELQAGMLDDQFARNGDLQARIAAVIAVATFAKEHKD